MRTFIGGVLLAAVSLSFGCDSSGDKKADTGQPPAKTQAASTCIMKSGGRAVLRVSVAANVKCTVESAALNLKSDNLEVHIWLVPGAKTVDEAVGRVGKTIESEFRNFKATSTTATTVAGGPAKRLMGSGVEADDNDPGTADVVVFKAGANVFVACTHGEHLSSAAQQWMTTVLQTAQAL